jgi:hypothetical protein
MTARPVTINLSGSVSREVTLDLTSVAPPTSKCGIASKPGPSSSNRLVNFPIQLRLGRAKFLSPSPPPARNSNSDAGAVLSPKARELGMSSEADYRTKAAHLAAVAKNETNPRVKGELERLAASYLRLAARASAKRKTDLVYAPQPAPALQSHSKENEG